MTSLPSAFKSLLSLVKRADELDKDPTRENQIVAYHIRYYAVSKATKLMTGDPEEQKFLAGQLDLLEKLSPKLKIAEGEGKTVCIQQATALFDRADEIDRAGYADKGTAKLFYTCATIYDALEQFGEMDNEISERKKYAKWKAADIVNAINAGEKPTPGGFGEEPISESAPPSIIPTPQVTNNTNNGGPTPGIGYPNFDIPSAPINRTVPALPSDFNLPPTAPTSYPTVNPTQGFHQPPPRPNPPAYPPQQQSHQNLGLQPPPQQQQQYQFPVTPIPRGPPQSPADPRVKDTVELCNFAISALNHNNIALAKERLQEALRRLG